MLTRRMLSFKEEHFLNKTRVYSGELLKMKAMPSNTINLELLGWQMKDLITVMLRSFTLL